ncbi:hypothetical protein K493DRAFT_304583 [Basidiobolus meristosporus CBS 931.73]|uniref:UNC93-like protein n=1 Tax=Basidiobolus meristosporus CBS 931.73 TaxID=1314790 RepID=A0A1Y1XZM0_9FUNG|nr:hypothetical protein K493DRAFT_304583 [Basidiobolus meristosporus CBS 931.73]|eukprot:ORX90814.1 hypothetical protein K493DRAFT_304583 [Basidiobolus meristosporus CBS 931.73]
MDFEYQLRERTIMRVKGPLGQVLLVGFVCFACPGMLNTVIGIGAGGQMDDSAAKSGEVALYSCFAMMLLFTPLFISSNWFYSYQFGAVNGVLFNLRTRSLNNALYWGSQMLGAYGFREPSLTTLASVVVPELCMDWRLLERSSRPPGPEDLPFSSNTLVRITLSNIDFIDHPSEFWPKFILYIFYGMCDAMLQTYAYWVMGALSNDSSVLARYAGYYKGIQSAGVVIAWRIDAVGTAFLTQLIINWGLFTLSLPFTYFVAREVKVACNDGVEEKGEPTDSACSRHDHC